MGTGHPWESEIDYFMLWMTVNGASHVQAGLVCCMWNQVMIPDFKYRVTFQGDMGSTLLQIGVTYGILPANWKFENYIINCNDGQN